MFPGQAASGTDTDSVSTATCAASALESASPASRPAHSTTGPFLIPTILSLSGFIPVIDSTAINDQGHSSPQGEGHLVTGRFQNPTIGRAGDIHDACGLLMVDRLKVRQP